MKLKFENISIYNLEKRPSLPSILHCTSSYSGFSVSKYVDSGINIYKRFCGVGHCGLTDSGDDCRCCWGLLTTQLDHHRALKQLSASTQ